MKHAFIIGAPRCGTTTIHSWFEQNAEVLTSFPKESNYFRTEFHKGFQFYIDKYFNIDRKLRSHKVLLDVTPSLSWIGYCAQRMYDDFPNAKIVYMTRNPLERIYSGWKLVHEMRHGREPDSFPRYIQRNLIKTDIHKFDREGDYVPTVDKSGETYTPNAIEATMYYSQVKRFIELGYEVEMITLEELSANPAFIYKRLCNLFQVEQHEVELIEKNINEHWVQPKHKLPSLNYHEIIDAYPAESRIIKNFFKNEVQMLGNIFNRDLMQEWNFE